jgi:2',3'-cyclic-nucleotide 2'-phosphodiesterase/3'-nucleotidase
MTWFTRAGNAPLNIALVATAFMLACATDGKVKPETGASPQAAPSAGKDPAPPAPEPVPITAHSVGINADVEADPGLVKMLAPRAATVRAAAERVVGQLKAPLSRGKPESTMGNFVTDAMRHAMERATGKIPDLCFTNMGGLRRDLPAGQITAGMVTELMPFDNSVVVFVLDGKSLWALMERLAQRGDALSGATYIRQGDRLHEVKVGGNAWAEGTRYRVCTNDYVFDGGGNYPLKGAEQVNTTGVLLRDAIMEQFEEAQKSKKDIAARLEGRATWGDPR